MSNEIVPRDKVTKHGVQGIVTVVGGIGALILNAVAAGIPGIIVGGLITIAGLALSGSRQERGAGVVTTVVGASTLAASLPFLSRIFGPLVHGVLVAGGVVLLGIGVYSLVRFFRGLKSRS